VEHGHRQECHGIKAVGDKKRFAVADPVGDGSGDERQKIEDGRPDSHHQTLLGLAEAQSTLVGRAGQVKGKKHVEAVESPSFEQFHGIGIPEIGREFFENRYSICHGFKSINFSYCPTILQHLIIWLIDVPVFDHQS